MTGFASVEYSSVGVRFRTQGICANSVRQHEKLIGRHPTGPSFGIRPPSSLSSRPLELPASITGDCILKFEMPIRFILSRRKRFTIFIFQGALAKKPYNPILGETFYCSWKVPCTSNSHKPSTNSHIEHCSTASDDEKVTFVAEQVSHHPPSEYIVVRLSSNKQRKRIHYIFLKEMVVFKHLIDRDNVVKQNYRFSTHL